MPKMLIYSTLKQNFSKENAAYEEDGPQTYTFGKHIHITKCKIQEEVYVFEMLKIEISQ